MCCSLLAFSVRAQLIIREKGGSGATYVRITPIEKLEKASMECIYEYHVRDKEKNEIRTYFDILQSGREYTKYFGYPIYQVDSVIYRRDINKITEQEDNDISNQYGIYGCFAIHYSDT